MYLLLKSSVGLYSVPLGRTNLILFETVCLLHVFVLAVNCLLHYKQTEYREGKYHRCTISPLIISLHALIFIVELRNNLFIFICNVTLSTAIKISS